MGVDFHGYSNIRSELLPERFRRVYKHKSDTERKKAAERFRGLDPSMAILARAIFGDPEDNTYECNEAAEEEFYATIGAQKDFLTVCWDTNTIWFFTKETETAGACASYGSYAEFRTSVLRKYTGMGTAYMPPDTDMTMEHGIVSAVNCLTCVKTLDAVREHFVPADWAPFTGTDNSALEGDYAWLFACLYESVARGAESGVLLVH